MYYNVQFGCSSLKRVVIDTGEPPKLGSTGAPPLWDGAVADPLKTSPSSYLLSPQIGSSAAKGVA